jgi:riboflavin kinase
LKRITFRGTVVSGEGNGRRYLALPWVKGQIEKKLGYTIYLGTLNLKLSKAYIQKNKLLKKTKTDTISPQDGYCKGLLFKADIAGLKCGVVVPEAEGYPEDLIEIIAEVSLRETLSLKDGEVVTVSVEI